MLSHIYLTKEIRDLLIQYKYLLKIQSYKQQII